MSMQTIVDILYRLEIMKEFDKTEVFRYGSEGDLFYLILDGVVEIQIPDPKRQQDFLQCGKDIETSEFQIEKMEQSIKEVQRDIGLKYEKYTHAKMFEQKVLLNRELEIM